MAGQKEAESLSQKSQIWVIQTLRN